MLLCKGELEECTADDRRAPPGVNEGVSVIG